MLCPHVENFEIIQMNALVMLSWFPICIFHFDCYMRNLNANLDTKMFFNVFGRKFKLESTISKNIKI